METVRRAARPAGHEVRPVYEAMVQPSPAVAADRRGHPSLRRAFAAWDRLSLALITIGSWEEGESKLFDSPVLEEHLRRRATRAGIVDTLVIVEGAARLLLGSEADPRR